ncbi:MAG: hypothetical protein LBM77_09310 [Spirochaetaceae bacterium]|jgi:hypothetical protein|nr:hypothetical protein [Spirochaetaceae bacterium]
MKKIITVGLVALCLSTAAFAEHPNNFGIGVAGGGSYGGAFGGSAALSFKIPDVDVFWGVNIGGFGSKTLAVGVSGDYYLLDRYFKLQSSIVDIGYFIGLGGYGTIGIGDIFILNAGLRAPIGVTFQFFDNLLELFLDVAPSIGMKILPIKQFGLDWGVGFEGGLRLWF